MKQWACIVALALVGCGGIVVVDDGERQGGGGDASGGASQGNTGDAGPGDGGPPEDAGPTVYCNRKKGPMDYYDGEFGTGICEWWQVCAHFAGGWYCVHPDEAP